MATLIVDDTSIYYEEHGDGEPLLLVHGAAASGRWFGDLLPQLALGQSEQVAPERLDVA